MGGKLAKHKRGLTAVKMGASEMPAMRADDGVIVSASPSIDWESSKSSKKAATVKTDG